MQELALGQLVLLEHILDRLDVEFLGHVANRAIFLVKRLGGVGRLVVAFDQMLEHPVMAHQVVAEVHRHEAGELEEARIHLPPGARIEEGDGGDYVLLEPGERTLGGDGVDRGRSLAGVDRATHHAERRRRARILIRVHQADRGIGRHRRLAHRQHMRARADMLEELDQIIDIVVEIEAAGVERHQLRVAPVGNVDVMAGQHPLDRAAQQRGVVT